MIAYPARLSAAACARRFSIGAAFSLWAIVPAFCQTPTPYGQTPPPYETPLYRPPSSTLEQNYGVPSFGLPGSELPKQRTMGTQRSTSVEPDFLSSLGAQSKTDDGADALTEQRTMATQRSTASEPNFLSSLGAQSKTDDETDALPKPTTAGETPDMTTQDTTDNEGTERQRRAAPE
jgi:hypothetical protein